MILVALYWLPVLLWMGVIYTLSDRPDLTLSRVLPVFAFGHSARGLDLADLLLRKIAHVTEYAILTFLVFRALRCRRTGPPGRSLFGWSGLFSVAYAFTDELHQRFVPTRSGTLRDVVIDTAGVLLALAVLRIRSSPGEENVPSGRR